MARVLIPAYGFSPAVVVSDDDVVLGPGRVAHTYPNGNWVRVNSDGTVGSTPASSTPGINEIAAVAGSRKSDELRVFCPDPGSRKAFVFRMTDPNAVPNV